MTGMVEQSQKVMTGSSGENTFNGRRFRLVFTARCAETIHILEITVVGGCKSLSMRVPRLHAEARHTTTKDTPTCVSVHTGVQVLSKENEIWMINNK